MATTSGLQVGVSSGSCAAEVPSLARLVGPYTGGATYVDTGAAPPDLALARSDSFAILALSDSRIKSWGGAGRPSVWLTGSLCCLAFPIGLSIGCTNSLRVFPPSPPPMPQPQTSSSARPLTDVLLPHYLPSPAPTAAGTTATAELQAWLEACGAFEGRLKDAADINGAVPPPMPTAPSCPWSKAATVPRLAPCSSCHVLCCLVLVAGLLPLELLRRTRKTGGAATKSGAPSGCEPRRRARVVRTTRYAGRCGGYNKPTKARAPCLHHAQSSESLRIHPPPRPAQVRHTAAAACVAPGGWRSSPATRSRGYTAAQPRTCPGRGSND